MPLICEPMASRPTQPNEPLIAGVAQRTWKADCPGPVEMFAAVLEEACADSGAGRALLDRLDALCVVKYISADHHDPARLVSDRLGIQPAQRMHTCNGGDTPQAVIGELSGRIAAGELQAVAIVGGEAMKTWAQHDRAGTDAGWNANQPDSEPDEVFGIDRWGNSEVEMAVGFVAPIMVYPLFEHALWAKSGTSRSELSDRLGRLQERFSSVAERNPHSWGPVGLSAEQIATPSDSNRMVSLPYSKAMNANIQTDQAAAVILVSEQLADELGIEPAKRVYVHGSAHATESWNFSERDDLSRGPAIGRAACDALGQADATVEDMSTLDIYSCFPSAVEIACAEIGIDPLTEPRDLTQTGGLAFAGGPGNGYVLQSITATVEALRQNGGKGMVTAVGWYLTKNGIGIYGAEPPPSPFTTQIKSEEAPPSRQVATGAGLGEATAETATVIYDRDGGPALGLLTALLPDGRRALRGTGNSELMQWIDSGEPVTGKKIRLDAETEFEVL